MYKCTCSVRTGIFYLISEKSQLSQHCDLKPNTTKLQNRIMNGPTTNIDKTILLTRNLTLSPVQLQQYQQKENTKQSGQPLKKITYSYLSNTDVP